MTLRISPRLLLVAVVVTAVALAAYRVGAITSARPVVRQQFMKRLDPGIPDFIAGDPLWTDPDFYDDSAWGAALSLGITQPAQVIGLPGVEGIWSPMASEHHVAFRREFNSPGSGSASLIITCDNDYRAYLNGEFVGLDVDHDWLTPETFDLSGRLREGSNILAIDAIDFNDGSIGLACALTSNLFPSIVSDGTWRADATVFGDPIGTNEFSGTRWAVMDVPGVDRGSRVTAMLTSTSPGSWESLPQLQRTRELSGSNYRLLARPGQVLVQLTGRVMEGAEPLLKPGTYRLIVDTVTP